MFYSALGRVVWFGAKWYVRRRYGRLRPPTPFIAGGTLALAVVTALAVQRSQSD